METPDQQAAIDDVKTDMEMARPMDRLGVRRRGIRQDGGCAAGNVQGGDERQAGGGAGAHTVLAQQHYQSFFERMEKFPMTVDMLSRFRTDKEQDQVVRQLASGAIDVVIGTHRLVQKDVTFNDLGLVIIDEEHRFGVAQKERMKELRQEVDVLTLTATPIPRTLHMAMSGIRDISTIDTPPEERLPIKTYLAERSDDLLKEAIQRELDRGGQVFLLHNRVQSIRLAADHVRQLIPEARVLVAHGQMPEYELSDVMDRFTEGEADVLVCTTIIESGLDIPNVNTLIVDRADRFGLAQLYQLRGRIGRRLAAGVRLPNGRARSQAYGYRQAQAGDHPGGDGAGRRVPHRDEGPGDTRGGQPAGRRAERAYPRGGVRPVHAAALRGGCGSAR